MIWQATIQDLETKKQMAYWQQGVQKQIRKKRAEIYAELEKIVQTAAPYVPLYWRVDAVAHNENLTGVKIPPCGLYYVYDYAWK